MFLVYDNDFAIYFSIVLAKPPGLIPCLIRELVCIFFQQDLESKGLIKAIAEDYNKTL